MILAMHLQIGDDWLACWWEDTDVLTLLDRDGRERLRMTWADWPAGWTSGDKLLVAAFVCQQMMRPAVLLPGDIE